MRNFILITLILGVFILGVPCSGSYAVEKGPIKVGWIAGLTGLWAEVGKDMTNGFQMYMEEIGYKAAGREIVLIVEDGREVPDTSITKFRKLVTHDKVGVVAGVVAAPVGLAMNAAADQLETPMILPVNAVDDVTQKKRGKWAIRTGWAGSQPMFPFGEYVYKKLGYKKVVSVSVDFQFGYDQVGGFQKTFEASGGQMIQKIWAPQTTMDFGPFITPIRRDADAVFTTLGGAMCLKFPKQYQDAGINLPLIGGGAVPDESFLPAQGDEILGFISPLQYSAALNTPANRKFQEKYQKKYNKIPSYYSGHSYEAAMWLVKAIEAVKGDVENKEAFLQAIKNVKLINPPRMEGTLALDSYGNPVQNIYIRKVEKIKDHPNDFLKRGPMKWNTVIDTIPAVSQFWKWDPEEYMKQPPYSHDYPPCSYCK